MTEQEKRKEIFELFHGIMEKYRNDEHEIAVKIAGIAGSLLVLVDSEDDDSINEILSMAMQKSMQIIILKQFATKGVQK